MAVEIQQIGDILSGLTNKIRSIVVGKYSSTNPYSPGLYHFFNTVVERDSRQIHLLVEHTDYPDLKAFIGVDRLKNGDLDRFFIKAASRQQYEETKKKFPELAKFDIDNLVRESKP